jgi:carotenoid cleavage dioxygenase-like enzyme
MAFHIANAWEEEDGNIVKLYLCTMNQFTMSSTDVGVSSFGDSSASLVLVGGLKCLGFDVSKV